MTDKNEIMDQEPIELNPFENEEHKPNKVLTFLINYKWHMTVALGVVAVVIGGLFGYRAYKDSKEKKASLALSRIKDVYDSGDYKKALEGDANLTIRGEAIMGLVEISEQFGSTNAGKTAALLCGDAQLKSGKYDEAITAFEKASSSDSPIIQVGALAGLGSANELKNNLKSAVESYEKAAKIAELTGGEERYIYYAAFCLEKLNEKDKAIEKYKEILTKSEVNDYTGYAKAGLTRLGQSIEL